MSLAYRWQHTARAEEKQASPKTEPFGDCVSFLFEYTLSVGRSAICGVHHIGRDFWVFAVPVLNTKTVTGEVCLRPAAIRVSAVSSAAFCQNV